MYKSNELSPGYVWVPYIMTDNVIIGVTVKNKRISNIQELWGFPPKDNVDFQPSNSISSRYSKKIVNNNFYGVIK
jgi:hypothetical protein